MLINVILANHSW